MKKVFLVIASILILLALVTLFAYTHAVAQTRLPAATACSETGLTGPAQQENLLFCNGVALDGGAIYKAAIADAANHRVIVGTPIRVTTSKDWGGAAITYVEFSSGFHMEYHADGVIRTYNSSNAQVGP